MRVFSENKYIDYLLCGLLGLVAANFMHFGQFVLPLMCLVLFVDNHLRFNFGNIWIFIILCLFGISFFAFSYKLGFYAVMGFCMPMAYYVGANVKNPQSNIKKIVYIIALSMGLHVLLNGIYDMYIHLVVGNFYSAAHYDIWTRDKMSSTATALNLDILIGMLYYIIRYEKNKGLKYISLTGFALAIAYCMFAGRRTPVLLTIICLFISFCYDGLLKNGLSVKQKKAFVGVFVAGALFVLTIVLIYQLNLFNAQYHFNRTYIFIKFSKGLIDNSRIGTYISAVKLMPEHLWGGQEISSIIGMQVHDLWIDIYDYAGVITWAITLVYTTHYLFTMFKVMSTDKISQPVKTMLLTVFVCIALQMLLEPVMTGASIFAIVCVIIGAVEERLLNNE